MSAKLTRNTLDPARLPPTLSPRQFVDLSGFSSATVYRWLESGYLRGTKAGQKLWRIPRSELSRVAGWEGGTRMKFYQTVLLAVAAFVLPALFLGGVWWWLNVIRLVVIGAFF